MSSLVLLIWSLLVGFLNPLIASEPSVASYRKTVGPPIVFVPDNAPQSASPKGRLIVVNWNVHVGHGDVSGLVDNISSIEKASGFGTPQFVLLLEETFRQGDDIPSAAGIKVPRRIAPPDSKLDIEDVARKLGWWLYYAPSMRNGNGLGANSEDRGNAILSSLPIEAVEAVELPFALQRRVALIATIVDTQKQPRLRVAVTHFDTRASLLRGWIFGGSAVRNNQAKGFVSALRKFHTDGLPLIVGGDLNTYLGTKKVVDTISVIAPQTDCGNEPTHTWGARLDHMFARVPADWPDRCVRGKSTFGSDHYPLILPLNVSW
jgi:endonuclease/exonuclease/phosphatase family metal-dependent hydrolase